MPELKLHYNSFAKPNILIVDDSIEILDILSRMLAKLRCNIIRAASGQAALERLNEYDTALILLDVKMPDIDGFETAELIHKNENTRGIPIIFITGITTEEKYISRYSITGSIDYLFKPIDMRILIPKVNIYLRQYNDMKKHEYLINLQQMIRNEFDITKEMNKYSNIKSVKEFIHESAGLNTDRNDHDRRLRRGQDALCVIRSGIDQFNYIIDTYGNDFGNFTIEKAYNRLKNSIRNIDLATCLNDDEFLLFLNKTNVREGHSIAERIRRQVEHMTIEYKNKKINVTMSFGVAKYNNKIPITESIILADKSLNKAKQLGMNLVVSDII